MARKGRLEGGAFKVHVPARTRKRYKKNAVYVRKIGKTYRGQPSIDYQKGFRWRVISVHKGELFPSSEMRFRSNEKQKALKVSRKWRIDRGI